MSLGLRLAALMTFLSALVLSHSAVGSKSQDCLNPIPESSLFRTLSCMQRESHHNPSTLGVEAEGQENSGSYLATYQVGVLLGLYNICLKKQIIEGKIRELCEPLCNQGT